jgi:UDP-N-acetylglucosamine diphosphorylase/glucosamine-1-phosphate N-acetyltransferase
MNICLDDNSKHLDFAPLTLLKPLAKLRIGLMTIEERWSQFFQMAQISYNTEPYLAAKYPSNPKPDFTLAATAIPSKALVDELIKGPEGEYYKNNNWIGTKGQATTKHALKTDCILLERRWDLYELNEEIIKKDFSLLTAGRNSQLLSSTVTVIGDPNLVFFEEGAKAEACVLNTTDGPIYLDKKAEIMEGSFVRGPFGLGESATLKMGAKIYGGTSIGPHCKIGGEVSNSLFQGYSNKGHDGFVGNSLIGEWCNLGADTNTSNLKNNYSVVRTYSYAEGKEVQTDMQFMGLTMGDHSKCGINTMFNTATVVGMACNVYGGDFPDKFIPSFSWGGAELVPFKLDKAIEASNNMMKRRGLHLDEHDLKMFEYLSKH